MPGGSRLPVLPAAGSGHGGYYQDDGPGDHPPDGLLDLPDAVPKVEPYSPTGNKPYVVFGKTYVPITDGRPFKQRGTGSWYGKKFHGQKTSSGELYDMYKLTAAHPTLPIPSYARVTNLANGKQVIVRINDRGPFHSERIIDLSYTAALKLGYLGSGSSQLEVERLLPDDIARINAAKQAGGVAQVAPPAAAQSVPLVPLMAALPDKEAVPAPLETAPAAVSASTPTPAASDRSMPACAKPASSRATPNITSRWRMTRATWPRRWRPSGPRSPDFTRSGRSCRHARCSPSGHAPSQPRRGGKSRG